MNPKIKSLQSLKKILKTLRKRNKRIVFTNGCFDLLHRGHIDYLKRARSLGDVLVVGLNTDDSVRRLKGKSRPVTAQEDRAEILASLEFVDFVTIFKEDTPFKLINELRPDILVKGADWKKGRIVGRAIVESCGGRVKTLKYLKGYSTSELVKKIAKDFS